MLCICQLPHPSHLAFPWPFLISNIQVHVRSQSQGQYTNSHLKTKIQPLEIATESPPGQAGTGEAATPSDRTKIDCWQITRRLPNTISQAVLPSDPISLSLSTEALLPEMFSLTYFPNIPPPFTQALHQAKSRRNQS